eukprot:Opistho-2@93418
MEYLHSNSPPLLHLDLKSPNLLIDDRMRLKVSDFGLATLQRAKSENHAIGTLYWMAPELITGTDQLTGAADVYSYGGVSRLRLGGCWLTITTQSPLSIMLSYTRTTLSPLS